MRCPLLVLFGLFGLFGLLSFFVNGASFSLPPDIERTFRQASEPLPENPLVPRREKDTFLLYLKENWRTIIENIESLPPEDGIELEKGTKFNVSVIHFGYACAKLPPEEYVEFFEHFVSLYEQKRISFIAFQNIYSGGDDKIHFWSVNWEHPRVQAIFTRILKFEPPVDEAFRSMVEAQMRGELAGTYLNDLGHDDPLPETLPGVKLQRLPDWLVEKYKTLPGKKVRSDLRSDPPAERLGKPPAASTTANTKGLTFSWYPLGAIAIIIGLVLAIFLGRRFVSSRSLSE